MTRALSGVRGLTVASAATVDLVIFSVWNPHATRRIYLAEFSIFAVTAPTPGAGLYLRRITARGTPGSTVTPIAPQSYENDAVPASGWLLDLGLFSVAPTIVAMPPLSPPILLANSIGAGLVYPAPGYQGIMVPPGQGIAFCNRAAVICPALEVGVVVGD